MKFGGTSVEDTKAFRRVAEIISAQRGLMPVVVVSAMSKVTDALLSAVALSADGKPEEAFQSLSQHFDRHRVVARELLNSEADADFEVKLAITAKSIANLLHQVAKRERSLLMLQDAILSFGERLSSRLLAHVLNANGLDAKYVDSRRCVVTDEDYGRAVPIMSDTKEHTNEEIQPLLKSNQVAVMGGFIASSLSGNTTTLGRGGSDYSAALIGAALDAREIQIWTDVTGVLTADPRIVKNAQTVPKLSYDEAAELAYFGAKVLHPKTIQPAVAQNIPVRICNSKQPEEYGTLVCSESECTERKVKAIAHKTNVTIVNINSLRMLGAFGFMHAIFDVFNRHRTVVDLVTTSEVSVSVSLDDTSRLDLIVEELKRISTVTVENKRAMVCVVGEGLKTTPGIAAKVFSSINDINVSLISQGASKLNLTFVINETQVAEAVTRLHSALFENEEITTHPKEVLETETEVFM
jgi:aspartate kinase